MSNYLQPYGGHLNLGACNTTPTFCGGCARPLPPTNVCNYCEPVPACPPPPATPTEPKCYVAGIPSAHQNLLLDVDFDGQVSIEQVVLRLRPNTHTFNLTTDVLPVGWTFDALNGLLYYPVGYKPSGQFAIWTAPTAQDSCGTFKWTAVAICLKVEEGKCSDMASLAATANQTYYCLSTHILTTAAAALADIRAAFGQQVQLTADGGLTGSSLFQLGAAAQPAAFAGTANVQAGVWNLGRCDAPGFSVSGPQLCNAIGNLQAETVIPATGEIVVSSTAGCVRVPFFPQQAPDCDLLSGSVVVMTDQGWGRAKRRMAVRRITASGALLPATDEVVLIDASGIGAGTINFALAVPGDCDPNEVWIKRIDNNALATVNITFAPGIDGDPSIPLGPTTLFSSLAGEGVHLAYDAPGWWVI